MRFFCWCSLWCRCSRMIVMTEHSHHVFFSIFEQTSFMAFYNNHLIHFQQPCSYKRSTNGKYSLYIFVYVQSTEKHQRRNNSGDDTMCLPQSVSCTTTYTAGAHIVKNIQQNKRHKDPNYNTAHSLQ